MFFKYWSFDACIWCLYLHSKTRLPSSMNFFLTETKMDQYTLKLLTSRSCTTVLLKKLWLRSPINYDLNVSFMYFRADRNIALAFLSGVHPDKIISS